MEGEIMEKALQRFLKIREELFDAIKKDLEKDGHCKSYEGAMEIGFPNFFDDSAPHENSWRITLHCYVVGPRRHYEWMGKTLDEAVGKMEKDIKKWLSPTYY
jgi:hypothetical protein